MQDHETRPPMRLGERLRQLRTQRGYTQALIADDAGMTTSAISALERGEFIPSVDALLRIAAALEVDPGDLLDGVRINWEADCDE